MADIPEGMRRDAEYWQTISELADARGYTTEDLLRHWPAYAMRRDITRFLSHYELFKLVRDLPGCIVELGVWRGSSLLTWSKLLDAFCPFDRSRKVFGFDSFEGLQNFLPEDGSATATDREIGRVEGGYAATEKELRQLAAASNTDSMIPGTERTHIFAGDATKDIPRFLEENPGLRISLLHLDMDLYEPTLRALELLYPLVVKGGVVTFDEYGMIPWQGETAAVDEYFAQIGESPKIVKHPWTQAPHGYFVK